MADTEDLNDLLDTPTEEEEVYERVSGYEWTDYVDDQGPVIITHRQIENFNDQISVQGDKKSQYIQFQSDRYIDGIDLATRKICIHYDWEDEEDETYTGDNNPAVNVEASENYIRFGWIIPAGATQYAGTLHVMPYAYFSENGEMTYIMKELYFEYTIHKGCKLSDGLVAPTDDWYEQFIASVDRYVQSAKEEADNSAASADKAAQYVEAASTSAEQAAEYSNAASKSASAAAASATKAQEIADATQSQVDAAKKYAQSASDSADLAGEKAAASAESAEEAKQYASASQAAAEVAEEFANTIQIVSNGVYVTTLKIPKTGWSTGTNNIEGFNYWTDITINGVTDKFYPQISINPTSFQAAVEAGFCQTVMTLRNTIRVWAQKAPTEDIYGNLALLYTNESTSGTITTLPPATYTSLGVVQIGDNVKVDNVGIISVESNDVVEETLTTDTETNEVLDEIFG